MSEKLEELIAGLVRPAVRRLSPYHVPDPGDLVKLDAMENPYPWPGELTGDWLECLRGVQINRYPDPAARRLKSRLRQVMNVPDGAELLLGNGSDEIIQLILLSLSGPGRVVLAPEPSFVMYRLLAIAAGMEYVGIPLQASDFALDVPALLEAIGRHKPSVLFLAYPNNPTGNLFSSDQMRTILEASPGLVVIDEAYTPFALQSFLGDLPGEGRLLVMRTVSKIGLAGLRLGWLAGHPGWIREFDKLRLPYNINVLTQLSAEFALAHADVIEADTARIRRDRDSLYAEMCTVEGIKVWPSRANFILFRMPEGRADLVHESLKRSGVLVKNLNGSSPLLRDCLRVTVGKAEENRAFLDALRAAL